MISARKSRAGAAAHPDFQARTPVKKLSLVFGAAAVFLAACASSPEPAPAPAPAPKQSLPITPPASKPALAAPAPTPSRRCDASVTFQNDETFAFAKAELGAAAKGRLDRDVLGKLAGCAVIESVVIEGHTDRIGSQQYNQKLSDRRAESVKAYLVSKGVDRNKVETIGMGKTVPAKFCPDSKNRADLIACLAPNRRAITSMKGTAK
jgi:OOP family OmpA-OmpF porin